MTYELHKLMGGRSKHVKPAMARKGTVKLRRLKGVRMMVTIRVPVTLVLTREMKLRMKVAGWLMRMAGWVLGCTVDVQESTE